MSFWTDILNYLLPPRCLKCGKVLTEDSGLCSDCFNEISFISQPYCRKCGHPFEDAPANKQMLCGNCLKKKSSPFRLSRSAFRYDEASKPLVLSFKFQDKTENAVVLAKMMYVAGHDIWEQGVDIIVPIPLHYARLIKRRYNQASLLAKQLEKLSKIKVDYDSVVRHKHTRPQVEFSGHQRVKNVHGVFSVKHPEKLKGKRVLLIDDIMTTGSTLKECAIAMKKAGAKSVDTLTVARVCR